MLLDKAKNVIEIISNIFIQSITTLQMQIYVIGYVASRWKRENRVAGIKTHGTEAHECSLLVREEG